MRKTTHGILVLIGASIARAVVTGDPVQALLVPALAAFHESYSSAGGATKGINAAHVMLWIYAPWAYIAWMSAWEIATIKVNRKKRIRSSKGEIKITNHARTIASEDIINHSAWSILAQLEIRILGKYFEAEFLGNILPTDPIFDENFVMQDMVEASSRVNSTWGMVKNIMIISVLLASALLGGYVGLAAGASISMVILLSSPQQSPEKEAEGDYALAGLTLRRGCKIPLSDGVYRLFVRILDAPHHVGIGYVKDGVMHTRHHVTNGNGLNIDDVIYPTTYVNKVKDSVTYGGQPRYAPVAAREELVVAMAGPQSNYVVPYKTRAEVDNNGNLVFYGNRSIPGTSGSPVFKRSNVTLRDAEGNEVVSTEYALVGTIGWFADVKIGDDKMGVFDDRKSMEIVPTDPQTSEYHVRFVPGDVTQVFKHPGSGKTRTVALDLITDGINKYNKVYFTGPTRVVCQEAYNIMSQRFPDMVSLMTSSATTIERGSHHRPVVIMAHATALNMLAKGSADVMKKGLWIMDEAHYMDSKTMVLKDYLRHKVKKEHAGSLVEMTATGYDLCKGTYVLADGSNYEITDIESSVPNMIEGILEDALIKKVLVYVTATRGRDATTAASLAREIEKKGGYYIMLSRETFTTNYKEAQTMSKGVILSTDITECGANIHPDVVYDFQQTSKVVAIGRNAPLERRMIDQGQRIQRRGRVGRKPSTFVPMYISPGLPLPICDFHRIEHHERHAVSKALGITMLDPTVDAPALDDISISPEQVAAWAASGEGGLNSLRAIHAFTNQRGTPLSQEEVNHAVVEWANGDEVDVRIGQDRVVNCSWWDHRDETFLKKLLMRTGKIENNLPNHEMTLSMPSFITRILNKSRPPIVNRFGVIRECLNEKDDEEEYDGTREVNDEDDDDDDDDQDSQNTTADRANRMQ